MMRIIGHGAVVLLLTALTQIGGIAWLLPLRARRVWLSFPLLYMGLTGAALLVAPAFGRVPLPCLPGGALQSQSIVYCALNRHYVTPQMADVAYDLAAQMATDHPGTITVTLDAGFPFFTGFPLRPHLSQDDGEKLDLASYWQDTKGAYLPGRSKSPVGYWGYTEGPTNCPKTWRDLRWDFAWLNAGLPYYQLAPDRMRSALRHLASDPRVGKVLVEPHVSQAMGIAHSKLRFQGCRAARHDDHLHIQL